MTIEAIFMEDPYDIIMFYGDQCIPVLLKQIEKAIRADDDTLAMHLDSILQQVEKLILASSDDPKMPIQ